MSKLFTTMGQNFAYLIQRAFFMLVLTASIAVGSGHAWAASPAAGTVIGNQASATYEDASLAKRSVTSNVVTAVVQQVPALTLDSPLSKTVVAGGQVVYPLALTNTGNGTDTFVLNSTQTGPFSFTSVQFYADANGDGVADNTTPITISTALAQGEVFRFVAVATVPTTALNAQVNLLGVTAASNFGGGLTPSKQVTETTTVTSNAVINMSKSMSAAAGAPGSGPYTVYLNYSNTGNTTATNVILKDALPAGMVYVPGTGRWSSAPGVALIDSPVTPVTSGAGTVISYNFGVSATNQVSAQISAVPYGQSGVVSFQVTIATYSAVSATGQLAGVVNNIATYQYNDGAANIGPANSNAFAFNVTPVISVAMNGAIVASATQGSTVVFNNVVKNNSNTTDSFDITVDTAASGFPAGSSYALFQADGVTPMLDTNGNGVLDTGPLASGASYTVTLKVTLPTLSTAPGPFTVSKTARSKIDPAQSATVVDTLSAIGANTVNLTNNTSTIAATTPGYLTTTAGETTPQVTNTVNPGATTRFTLYVNNTSGVGVPDSFDLSATGLPAGWTVVFRNAAGAVISNSGVVNGNASTLVYADVTPPATQVALPAGVSVYFRVQSPTSGALDVVRDAVVVNTIRSVQLAPNNNGQVFPGGIIVYSHTLSNNGNVTETAGSIALALTDTIGTFSSIVYVDVNGNGIIDVTTDLVVNGSSNLPSLAPGASVGLLVKVTAPSGAAIGAIDVTNLTATTSGPINGIAPSAPVTVADTTNVIAGNLSLLKEQALDRSCDGLNNSTGLAFASTNITTGAVPGACIRYRVTATNLGTANALNVVISDATPANTTYFATPAANLTKAGAIVGAVTTPASGSAGTISADLGAGVALAPTEAVVLTFSVRINP